MSFSIGIDYRVAVAHAPGVGRYVRESTRALAEISAADASFRLKLIDVGSEPDALPRASLGIDPSAGGARVVHQRFFWPRRLECAVARFGFRAGRAARGLDIFHHARSPYLDLETGNQTIAIGDLPESPLSLDELSAVAARCAVVFAFAGAAVEPIARALDLDPSRLRAVPVGADHWSREIRVPPCAASPPRILALGAQTARRAPLDLFLAFERAIVVGEIPSDTRLCLAGRRESADPAFLAALAASRFRDRVAFVTPGEPELPRLVAESSLMVHLHREALTPVTPLEALSCGVPVLVDDVPVFREALGAGAEYVADARDSNALASGMGRAFASRDDATAAATRAAIASRFTWRRNAEATLAVWRDAPRA